MHDGIQSWIIYFRIFDFIILEIKMVAIFVLLERFVTSLFTALLKALKSSCVSKL